MTQRLLHVRISGTDQVLRGYLSEHPAEAYAVRREGDFVTLELTVPAAKSDLLQKLGLKVEVLYDASLRSRERQKLVGQGNRFAGGKTPAGLGVRRWAWRPVCWRLLGLLCIRRRLGERP